MPPDLASQGFAAVGVRRAAFGEVFAVRETALPMARIAGVHPLRYAIADSVDDFAALLRHSPMHYTPPPDRPGLLGRTFDHAQREAFRHAAEHPAVDRKVIVVLLTTAVTLTLQEYIFRSGTLAGAVGVLEQVGAAGLGHWIDRQTTSPQDRQLAELIYWAAGTVVNYVVIPSLVVKLLLRERLAGFGLRVRGILGSSWIYVAMFAGMIGPLVYFSQTSAFQAKYPFYRPLPGEPFWPRFWTWELFYAAQFFALEFFFRGFMLHGLRHRFGFYAIFVMTVPYCMIHYGKPMPETFGAIGAGIILGFMSLKTRSIWFGAGLHVAVALSMDFLALWHKGMLG
jgi:membrane protease YdiL (CAAX protease family)